MVLLPFSDGTATYCHGCVIDTNCAVPCNGGRCYVKFDGNQIIGRECAIGLWNVDDITAGECSIRNRLTICICDTEMCNHPRNDANWLSNNNPTTPTTVITTKSTTTPIPTTTDPLFNLDCSLPDDPGCNDATLCTVSDDIVRKVYEASCPHQCEKCATVCEDIEDKCTDSTYCTSAINELADFYKSVCPKQCGVC
ncbi:hypothetical protein SNEBB_006015 [Seison nebaliae]|nr:hypothetical protein SNEBB_006015 [Seison nebaliae]